MNKPAVFFAGTTGLLALSTLYLAWRLHQIETGARPDAMVALPPATARDVAPASGAHTDRAAPAGSISPGAARQAGASAVPGPGIPDGPADSQRSMMRPFARDFLRQYDDLALRETLLANARKGFVSRYAVLRDRLKLDPAKFDQLVALLAEESLDQQANYFRCVVDPACDLARVPPPRDRSDEFLALLGPEGHAQFTSYRDALPEWQAVIQLRGRLSESQYLRAGDAERLQMALTDARKRFAGELEQQGANLRGWGNGSGMLWYSGDGTVEQKLASATQYSRMLRQQASALLSAEQLTLFGQLQDELLASFGAYLQQAQPDPH